MAPIVAALSAFCIARREQHLRTIASAGGIGNTPRIKTGGPRHQSERISAAAGFPGAIQRALYRGDDVPRAAFESDAVVIAAFAVADALDLEAVRQGAVRGVSPTGSARPRLMLVQIMRQEVRRPDKVRLVDEGVVRRIIGADAEGGAWDILIVTRFGRVAGIAGINAADLGSMERFPWTSRSR